MLNHGTVLNRDWGGMFSGIVESVQPILSYEIADQSLRIVVAKPESFDDLKIGDSVACNGCCLTVEKFDNKTMQFALGAETLKVLQIELQKISLETFKPLNLERSMKFGDRIHGHLVTGHVQSLAKVTRAEKAGESWLLDVEIPEEFLAYIWEKGSVTLQGVSLTVNEISNNQVSVCLIPETQKLTNLTHYQVGEFINLEVDYFAKAFENFLKTRAFAKNIQQDVKV